jgi:alpha-glucuronidase
MSLKKIFVALAFILIFRSLAAEDGYRLWLRYDKISDPAILDSYRKQVTGLIVEGNTPVLNSAGKELQRGLTGLLGKDIPELATAGKSGAVIAGTPETSGIIRSLGLNRELDALNDEGFLIKTIKYRKKNVTVIAGKKPAGVLYGVFII